MAAVLTARQIRRTREWLQATLDKLEAERARLERLLAIYRAALDRSRLEHPGD